MPILNEPNRVGDWLKAVQPHQLSFNVVTMKGLGSGTATYESGLVLGKLTADGKFVPAASSGSDGSQTAVAILVKPLNMTTADAKAVVVDMGPARIIDRLHLRWGSSITTQGHRNAALAQLEANAKIKANPGA